MSQSPYGCSSGALESNALSMGKMRNPDLQDARANHPRHPVEVMLAELRDVGDRLEKTVVVLRERLTPVLKQQEYIAQELDGSPNEEMSPLAWELRLQVFRAERTRQQLALILELLEI